MPTNIDMHCHLLPRVDDGSKNSEESLKLIENMRQKGAEKIYFTPHLYSPRGRTSIEAIERKFCEFKKNSKDLEIEVELGSEVFLRPEIISEKLIPLGNSNFLLVELPDSRPAYLWELLEKIQRRGYVIILAHIERYDYLFSNENLITKLFKSNKPNPSIGRLKDMGIYLQINWSTIIKSKRSSEIYRLFEGGLIDFVGSDKHSLHDTRDIIDFNDARYSVFKNREYL